MKRVLGFLLGLVFALAPMGAFSYPIAVQHVYVNGDILTPGILNPNISTIVTWANGGVEHSNMGPLGIYATDVIPTSAAQATFGGAWGWKITDTTAGQVPLTVAAPASQTADILDTSINGVTKVLVDATNNLHAGSSTLYIGPGTTQSLDYGVTTPSLFTLTGGGLTVATGNVTAPTLTVSNAGVPLTVSGGSLTLNGPATFGGQVSVVGLVSSGQVSGTTVNVNAGLVLANNSNVGVVAGKASVGVDAGGILTFRSNTGQAQFQSVDGVSTYVTLGSTGLTAPKLTSTSGVVVGGPLTTASTGTFSSTLGVTGALTPSGGVSLPAFSAGTAITGGANIGVDGSNFTNFRTNTPASGFQFQNGNGTTTYATVSSAGINSTVPIQSTFLSNPGYVPPVFTNTGTAFASTLHMVAGSATMSGGVVTVGLSGGAAFTTISSYFCTGSIPANSFSGVGVTYNNYNSVSLSVSGGGTQVVSYICIGT